MSNFGYDSLAERGIIESFRYPVTARFDNFLRIVYEPSKNLEAWVNFEEVRGKFQVLVVVLDSIKTPSSFFIDIFHFLKDGKRRVYSKTTKSSDFILLSKDNPKYSLFRILEIKGGFAKIAAVLGMGNGDEPRETLGWIKLRDEKGAWTIWVINADLC